MLTAEFARPARKFLDKAEKQLATRLFDAIAALQTEPFPKGVKRVENHWVENEKVFRVRVGDYRILYCVNYGKNRLLVFNIDKRSLIYE